MSPRSGPGRRQRSDGDQSRERILEVAADLAAVRGLERLSLADLAEAAQMSKSGVYGLFGSKEDLQLAVLDKARALFTVEVVQPALFVPPGVERLLALCGGFLDYISRREWPSGCFFGSVAAELGGREGPLRDRVAAHQKEWLWLLTENVRYAVRAGELPSSVRPEQLAFELEIMLTGADIAYLLHGEREALERVREAVRFRVTPAPPGPS